MVTVDFIERFATAPVGNGITRYYHSPDCQGRQKELVFSGYAFVFIQMTILTALFYLFNAPITDIMLGDRSLSHITRAFAVVLLVHPMGRLIASLLRIQGKAKFYAIVNIFRFILTASLQVLLLVWRDMGVMAMVYGSIFAAWFDVFAMGPYILRQIRFKFDWSLLKPILHYGYPLIIAAISVTIISMMDRYLLRIFGALSLVGLYSFGYSISKMMTILWSTPFKQAFLPVVFEMEREPEKQRDFVKRSCTYIYTVAVMLWLFLSVFAKDFIMILARNPEFWAAWTIVPILAFKELQAGVVVYFSNGIVMAKRSMLISGTSVVRLMLSAALLVLLVPLLGALGAALAVLFGQIALNVIRAHYSRKLYGQVFEVSRLIAITGIGAGVFLTSFGVILLDLPIWLGVPLKLIIIAFFPLLIWLTKVLEDYEIAQIVNLIRPYRSKGVLKLIPIRH